MIRPQEVVLVCRKASEKGKRPGSVIAIRKLHGSVKPAKGTGTFYYWGACNSGWSELSSEKIYQAMTWLLLEMVEFHGVPMRQGRDCLQDWVEGYRDWSQDCGAMVGGIGSVE